LARPKIWWDKHRQVCGQNRARYHLVSIPVSSPRYGPSPIPPGRNYIDDHRVAVVCSARSGSTKSLGTTNLLLKASSEALQRPATGASRDPEYLTPGTSRTSRSRDWTSPLHSPDGSRSRSPSCSVLPNGGLSSTLTMSSIPPPTGNNHPPFFATVDLIRSEHITAARSSITSPAILRELEEEIEKDCDALRSFLMAIQVSIPCHSRTPPTHPPPRSSTRCLQDQKIQ